MIDNYDLISEKIQKDRADFYEKNENNEFEELIIRKFYILRDEIHEHLKRYSKIKKISKIVIAVLFLIFTVAAVIAGNYGGSKMLWFSLWIVFIFIDIFLFMIADYFENVVFKRLLHFIDNTQTTEFKDVNDNFKEDVDNENNSENL